MNSSIRFYEKEKCLFIEKRSLKKEILSQLEAKRQNQVQEGGAPTSNRTVAESCDTIPCGLQYCVICG